MKKDVVKINEAQLRNIVAESIKKVLKEDISIKDTFIQFEDTLNQVTEMLFNFENNIPIEQSKEFRRLIGKEWNNLWEAISAINETLTHLNSSRGISQGDLTFNELS